MKGLLTIRCQNCASNWVRSQAISLYEQQVIESKPCPKCTMPLLICLISESNKSGGERLAKKAKIRTSGNAVVA